MKNTLLKRLTIIIISLLALITIAGCALFSIKKPNSNEQLQISDSQVIAQNPSLTKHTDDQYFELVGFGQLEISQDNPYINLINPSENSVYLSFDVIYNDENLHSTKLIEPGKMEQYNVYSCLDAGEHTITYSINVYDLVDKKLLWPGIQQEQELLIKN